MHQSTPSTGPQVTHYSFPQRCKNVCSIVGVTAILVATCSNCDGGDDMDSTVGGDGGFPSIYLSMEGDLTPGPFNDGLSGQTPSMYLLEIDQVHFLRSPSDSEPVVAHIQEHYTREFDMLSAAQTWVSGLPGFPEGTFAYARILLMVARVDVETSLHLSSPPSTVPATLTITTALSDGMIDGQFRSRGWTRFAIEARGLSWIGALPQLDSTVDATILVEEGNTWLLFPLDPPLSVPPMPIGDYVVSVTFKVYQSLRWEDLNWPDYSQGVLDTEDTTCLEPIRVFGAAGYEIGVGSQ